MRFLSYSLLTFLIVLPFLMNAQTPTLEWAKQMDGGGTGRGYGRSITADATGKVYTVGYFSNTVDFDPGAGVLNLTAPGGGGFPDIFIVKIDPDGNLIWAKNMGGTSRDEGYSIAVDASGNVYTTGYFAGTSDFDPGPSVFNITSAGEDNIFVSKLDASGNLFGKKNV